MNVKTFTFNDYQENTYLLISNNKCVIIDPGNYYENENLALENFIKENSIKPEFILITHAHIDHVLGIKYLSDLYQVETYIPSIEKNMYENMISYSFILGMNNYNHYNNVKFIDSNSNLEFDGEKINILFLPGHSPGHLGFYLKNQNKCFSGDVIFKNSIGRTDLPGGDFNTLIKSIKNNLFLLDDDVTIYPGHGPLTTIIDEKESNPFIK